MFVNITVRRLVKKIVLNDKGTRLYRQGKLTIYKDGLKDDGGAEPGEEVFITDSRGRVVGGGFYDGYGPVGVRILYTGDIQDINDAIEDNIVRAYERRKTYPFKSKRIVYADADYLPGLIIDLYNKIAVIQTSSIGMDIRIDIIKKTLLRHGIAKYIYLKNIQKSRLDIGLDIYSEWLTHEKKPETIIDEGKARFIVNVESGQKTGFYLDHRINRLELPTIERAKKVIDLYSYTGGFGIQYLLNGAREAVFVEEDDEAIETLYRNLNINNVINNASVVHGKVEQFIEEENEADIVIIDPPALAPMKKSLKPAIKKYRAILTEILTNFRHRTLFISSCSYHIDRNTLLRDIIDYTMKRCDKKYWILGGVRGSSPDHMVRKPDKELDYLKAYLIRLDYPM